MGIKGQEANTTKSRYTEDVFPGNHTSVWGSYWDAGRWGYKCCHSFIKQSYCTGDAGKAAFATNSLVNSVKESTDASEKSQESIETVVTNEKITKSEESFEKFMEK